MMHIAVCIQNDDTRDLLSALFQLYETQNNCRLTGSFFKNATDFICDLIGGEYDLLFFSDTHNGQLITEIREKDRRVRLVRLAPADSAIPYDGDVWYCLAEPLSRAFVFPILDRLRDSTRQELQTGLLIRSRGSVVQLAFSHLEYVEVMDKTVIFHLTQGSTEEAFGTLSDFENRLLDLPDFIKIHRSFIINLRHVQKLEPSGILTQSGHSLPISRRLYPQLKKDYLCHMMVSEAKADILPQSPPLTENGTKSGYSVLLVDDEVDQQLRWAGVCTAHGCTVQTAQSGETALALAERGRYDCVVLDVKLGDQCGFDLCDALAKCTGAPVIFLSNLDDNDSQTQGFLSGGTDYITKNATPELFWLKIEARINLTRSNQIICSDGPLRLHLKERKVFLLGQEVTLSAVEYELLWFLMQNPAEVFTPSRLDEVIWGARQWDSGSGVQLHLSLLERKLAHICPQHSFIETVWGKGYHFVAMPRSQEIADEK